MAKKGEETVYISDWKKFFHVQTKAEQSFCKAMYFRMYKIQQFIFFIEVWWHIEAVSFLTEILK